MSDRSQTVDGYLASLEPERRTALTELRTLVLEVVPDAVESMRYRMPTYEYQTGGVFCAFASQKHYLSLYLVPEMLERYREALAGLDLGKSCIRFKKRETLPLDTIRTILQETVQGIRRV